MDEHHVKEEKKVHGFVRHTSKINGFIEIIKNLFANHSSRRYAIIGVILLAVAVIPSVAFLGQQTHLFQFAYVPGEGGGGGVCPSPGTTVAGKYCCGNNVCQQFYSNSTCGTITKTLQYCLSCSNGGATCKPFPTPTPTPTPACTGTCGGVACTAANNLVPASGQCPAGRYCCKSNGSTDITPSAATCTSVSQQYCAPKIEGCGTDSTGSGTCATNQVCCLKNSSTSCTDNTPFCSTVNIGQQCYEKASKSTSGICSYTLQCAYNTACDPDAGCKNIKGAACIASAACKANDGVAVITPGASLCAAGQVCCRQAPPTPTIMPSCAAKGYACLPSNTDNANHPSKYVCLGTPAAAQDCIDNSNKNHDSEFCCEGAYATPTPIPLPAGDRCIGVDFYGNANPKDLEVGVCLYGKAQPPYVTTNYSHACGPLQCINNGHYVDGATDCATLLPGTHDIGQELLGCQNSFGGSVCCSPVGTTTNVPYRPAANNNPLGLVNSYCAGTGPNNTVQVGYCSYSVPFAPQVNSCSKDFVPYLEAYGPATKDQILKAIGTLSFHNINQNAQSCKGVGVETNCCAPDFATSSFTCNLAIGGICGSPGNQPDSQHTFNNTQYNCPSGQVCYTACPANTSCTSSNSGNNNNGNNNSGNTSNSGNNGNGGGPTCTNGQTTSFSITITVPGIGQGNFQNGTPKHNSRNVKLEVVDLNSNKTVKIVPRNGTYSLNTDGTITFSNVNLGSTLGCGGNYKVRVTVPGSLKVLSDQAVQYGTSNNNLTATLLPGDIVDAVNHQLGSDNQITIEDYNVMAACENQTSVQFNAWGQNITIDCTNVTNLLDYTDGGTQETLNDSGINEWASNYNTMIRSWVTSGGNGQ